MTFGRIWERYFFFRLAKSTLLFIVSFYALYVLIDYASHTTKFHHHHVKFQWLEVTRYYSCEFIRRLDVLLPFALLIATIQTLCNLNSHNELIALMSSGLSLKRLMRPLLLFALLCTGLVYLNSECFLPWASQQLKRIEDRRSHEKQKLREITTAQHIILPDHTLLLFQDYNADQKEFFDVYWVRTIDDLYRMQSLTSGQPPIGRHIDHLVRNETGQLVSRQSVTERAFPEIFFNEEILFETMTQPEDLSLSDLSKKHPVIQAQISEKDSQLQTVLYRKLAMPWLCLLAVIGPAPLCLRIHRDLPLFFIYAGSIFGLVAIYLMLSAAALLGKRQILSPLLAVWPLFGTFFGIFTLRFLRLR
jgi:lipopolysaccharide export system permease protein